MSFVYPRTITIKRPPAQPVNQVGDQGEAPDGDRANETLIASSVRCSIQARREGTKGPLGLPTDGTLTTWWVLIPKAAMAKGSIQDNDIVLDDLNERYQVVANYWNSLGYRLSVQKLAA